jgi:transcriptional regulator with XRE-family HTH domain/tetratricopeptide (TPR) repeat protein
MVDDDLTLGEWLRRRRRGLDLTQKELAQRVGCGVTTIRKIEAGERRPSKELATQLAACLEIAPGEYATFITFARAEPYPGRPPSPTAAARPPGFSSAQVATTPLPPFLAQETPPPKLPPVFVARERELAGLETALAMVQSGKGQILFVIGGSGRGKTMLVQEFARRAQAADPELIVASGYCNAHTGLGDPYLPFRELLSLLTGDVEAKWAAGLLTPAHAQRLWELMPLTVPALVKQAPDLIGSFVPAEPLRERATAFAPSNAPWFKQLMTIAARAPSPGLEQKQITAQYTALLKSVAARRPLLLIMEDLHWVDASSNALLFHLSREVSNDRILIVGSYRPDEVAVSRGEVRHPLADILGELKRRHGDIWLDLGDLAPAEGQRFVEAYLDTQPNRLGRAFREALFRHTEGHALFTVELLREMQERGDLRQDANGYWVAGETIDWAKLPARVEGVIEKRIGRLPRELQAILTAASVEGETFTAEVVARVQQLNERGLVQQLSRELDKQHRLVRAQALERVGQQRLSFYCFRHHLFQQYLYHSLDETERAYLHEAVGQALEALYGEQTEQVAVQLAHHFEQAALTEKAVSYLLQAGDHARRVAAPDEAIGFYRAGLERWPNGEQARQAETLRKLGECLWLIGQFQDALAAYEAGQALFEQLGNRVQAGAMQRLIGRLYWEQGGDRARALHHYHQALAILEEGQESVELARAISAISRMHMSASENDQAIAWGERALALAERLGAEDAIIHALNNIGTAYAAYRDRDRGLAMLQESLRRALTVGLPHDACRAYGNMGDGLIWACRYAEARATFEELLIYATRVHAIVFVGFALSRLGELDWLGGRWAAALARQPRLREWMERVPTSTAPRVWASTLLGWMHNDLGQPQTARQALEDDLPGARGLAEAQSTVLHLGQLARAFALLGPEAETTALVQEFLDLIDRTPDAHPSSTLPLLFACQWLASHPASGGLPAARACLWRLEQAHQQSGGMDIEAAYHEGQGIIALTEEDPTGAVEPFRYAARRWQALNRPYDQLRALCGLGRTLKQLGDLGQARTALDQALYLVEMLATQLDDPTLKTTFLNSRLVQEIQTHLVGGD